ncbi:hypothetical protein ABZ914_27945 [Spirillospora sp. NPDC046719]
MGLGLQREALIDSKRKLEVLQGREVRLQKELGHVKAQITSLTQVVTALTELVDAGFPFHDDPPLEEPAAADPRPGDETSPQTSTLPGNPGSGDAGTRNVGETQYRTRADDVRDLVGQDPARWWKARDVAECLDETNVKSVRMTLNIMVERKVLIKVRVSHSDTWYRYNDGVARPGPTEAQAASTSGQQLGAAI